MVDEFTNSEHFAGGFVSEHDVASAWTVHLVELAMADSACKFLDENLVADRSRQFNRLYAKRAWFLWQYGDAGFCRHVASLRVQCCLKQTEADARPPSGTLLDADYNVRLQVAPSRRAVRVGLRE